MEIRKLSNEIIEGRRLTRSNFKDNLKTGNHVYIRHDFFNFY